MGQSSSSPTDSPLVKQLLPLRNYFFLQKNNNLLNNQQSENEIQIIEILKTVETISSPMELKEVPLLQYSIVNFNFNMKTQQVEWKSFEEGGTVTAQRTSFHAPTEENSALIDYKIAESQVGSLYLTNWNEKLVKGDKQLTEAILKTVNALKEGTYLSPMSALTADYHGSDVAPTNMVQNMLLIATVTHQSSVNQVHFLVPMNHAISLQYSGSGFDVKVETSNRLSFPEFTVNLTLETLIPQPPEPEPLYGIGVTSCHIEPPRITSDKVDKLQLIAPMMASGKAAARPPVPSVTSQNKVVLEDQTREPTGHVKVEFQVLAEFPLVSDNYEPVDSNTKVVREWKYTRPPQQTVVDLDYNGTSISSKYNNRNYDDNLFE